MTSTPPGVARGRHGLDPGRNRGCVRRLQVNPDSPGSTVIAGEADQWTVGDGCYRIEGYYDELLPFLAREQVEEGLQYEGELPKLPPW